jgi:eukaryotic-like serine/threonine-protein kinase
MIGAEDDIPDGVPPADGAPPAPDDERTVFMPLAKSVPPTEAAPEPVVEEPVAEEPVKAPPAASEAAAAPAPVPSAPPAAPASAPPAPATPQTSFGVMAPRLEAGRIQEGDVLNHIFEVKRFIARGGMGEVFEGQNVTSDERVAIKVMLPSLAADPNVVAMFRKEARTLTRLSHPALVQYRVLAQEPQLGVLYIVTEFVDGKNLSDILGEVPRDSASLVALTRRLADGLRVAHELGAVHRDISPDNVLLEGGRLEGAKVIDFGIAKDLDPSTATIVGDGFAGKLNYVAPEQLGDFNREVGPWSDVYSLALVILAVALGKNVDMGATLVDAVDKRRAGPDLSAAPDGIRPVLEAMLKPNPADRLRSMAEVVAALDVVPYAVREKKPTAQPAAPAPPPQEKTVYMPAEAPAAAPPPPPREKTKPPAPSVPPGLPEQAEPPTLAQGEKTGGLPKPALFGAIAAGVIALIVAGVFMFGGGSPTPTAKEGPTAKKSAVPPAASPEAATRTALASSLPTIACSWLDVREIKVEGSAVALALTGVAGSPAQAQGTIRAAMAAAGVPDPSIDFEAVAPIQPSACQVLDAYRAIKVQTPPQLTVDQPKFEIAKSTDPARAAEKYATTIFHVSPGAEGSDMAVLGMEADGTVTQLFPDKKAFLSYTADHGSTGDVRTVQVEATTPGWSGYVLVTGKGPFPAALVAPSLTARGGDWAKNLAASAAANGWHAEMVWFKIVDEKPED